MKKVWLILLAIGIAYPLAGIATGIKASGNWITYSIQGKYSNGIFTQDKNAPVVRIGGPEVGTKNINAACVSKALNNTKSSYSTDKTYAANESPAAKATLEGVPVKITGYDGYQYTINAIGAPLPSSIKTPSTLKIIKLSVTAFFALEQC